jgi:hypothetical protein
MPLEKLEFLKACIDQRLVRIDSHRIDFKKRAFKSFILSTVLSAITTILLGLNIPSLAEVVRITALSLTTTVTVINAYNSYFSHKELWIANNIAKNRLLQLKFNIDYAEQGEQSISDSQIENFKKNYQDILNDLNATWQKNRLNQKT